MLSPNQRMYNFSYFKEPERSNVLAFMEKYPFVFLTGSYNNGQQVATQVPVMVIEKPDGLYVQGHLMRNTDHYKAFVENTNVLAVFTGPSAYVSAAWYATPQQGSTYNYMSVHVPGVIQFLSPEALRELMQRFTLKFEANNASSPTVFNNLPVDYLDKMLAAIVGFEIKIETLDTVFKLSQNRDEQSYTTIITELAKQGGNAAVIAEEMKKRQGQLFPKK